MDLYTVQELTMCVDLYNVHEPVHCAATYALDIDLYTVISTPCRLFAMTLAVHHPNPWNTGMRPKLCGFNSCKLRPFQVMYVKPYMNIWIKSDLLTRL